MSLKYLIIPEFDNLKECIDFARQNNLGFEFNDFFQPWKFADDSALNERIDTYLREISQDTVCTLHGCFFDICLDSSDPKIREICEMRCRNSIETAVKLGCKAVIFHTNYLSSFKSSGYRDNWVRLNAEFYRSVLRDYPDIEIYVENMFDDTPELLRRLADEMSDEPRFGVCFDIAHAFLTEVHLDIWFDELKPYIRHIHINDNYGNEDSHLAVGDGRIPWKQVGEYLEQLSNDVTVLIEVLGLDKAKKSLEYLKSVI